MKSMRWVRGALAALVALVGSVAGAKAGAPVELKDAKGRTTAVIITCNDCAKPGKGCYDGAEQGWREGRPCGKCLVQKAAGQPIEIVSDYHLSGKIVDPDGRPRKDRYVKFFVSNGWGHRTRTLEDGTFHLMLGGSAPKEEKKKAIPVSLGTLVDEQGEKDENFSFYLMPADFVPCDAP